MAICKYRVSKSVFLVLLVCMAITSNVYAVNKICYRGQSSGKAILNINGRLVKLKPGSRKNGVKLVTVNKDSIVVKVDGKRYQYKKNVSRGIILGEELTLSPNRSGNYMAKGKINGMGVKFVVDTGASYIAMNKKMARALKLDYGDNEVQIHTASGTEASYKVTLDTVSVGDIKLHDIPAVISKHDYPEKPLLGMSFLQYLDINQNDGQMTLSYSD